MECKDSARRQSTSAKPSKYGDEENDPIARSSSYKAKGVRSDEYVATENRIHWRTEYPSEAKPEVTNPICDAKEEKEIIVESPRRKQSELEAIECIQEEKADSEFEELMRTPNTGGEISIPTDPEALNIRNGFKIISMNMRDGATGKLVWESSAWGPDMFETELKEYIPKEILECRTVSREINFQSMAMLNKFRIEQRVFFQGQCVEEWFFSFGFVIPGSTNSWQQLIEAAPKEEMMAAEVLSGNIAFETSFFDDKILICKNLVRIYYI